MTDVSTPILVVEDTNASGSAIITLLNQAGFQHVDHVHGAVTALTRMRTTRYGLVISDVYMKSISGLDLLKQVRSDPSSADVRFLVMTGSSSRDLVVEARAAGADGFIAKPFTAQVLKDKIYQLLAPKARDTRAGDVDLFSA
jgi:two-component system, chemotaxis family, chemotaxis protein CheY